MSSEKGHVEIPMIMYEPHQEFYRQEPSAPEFSSQEGGYEYPSPPPYSYRETTTIEQPVYLVSQPPIIVAGIFSSKPTSTICPSCRQHITTQVTYRLGKLSYLLCTSLCMVGTQGIHLAKWDAKY
ncbi:cell death-inducing p53-target protein 1 [Pitangus sulphuratus]|nr:cell death-inducing p53-target protein 1 [Pitangus sulphuratus]